jgi:hypothetical protein
MRAMAFVFVSIAVSTPAAAQTWSNTSIHIGALDDQRRKLSRYTSEEILRLAQEGNVLPPTRACFVGNSKYARKDPPHLWRFLTFTRSSTRVKTEAHA